MRFYLSCLLLICSLAIYAQFYDDFSDGDYTSNPQWFMSNMNADISLENGRCGVVLHPTGTTANGCKKGSFRTPSLNMENTWWGCSFEITYSTQNRTNIRYYLSSLLPSLENCSAYFIEINLEQHHVSFNYADKTGEYLLMKSHDIKLSEGNMLLACNAAHKGKNWEIDCRVNERSIWKCSIEHSSKFDPTTSGFIISEDEHSSCNIKLLEANCGDKPKEENYTKSGDLVFTEIMYKPSPTVGLPNKEWVEIYNNTDHPIDLENHKISSRSKTGTINQYMLNPGEYAILCSQDAMLEMLDYTDKIAVVSSMPALINDGDLITLKNTRNSIIAHLEYRQEWHDEPFKENGGWSLEKKDTGYPIDDETNWSSSQDEKGGTPGEANSISCNIADAITPRITSFGIESPTSINFTFNKPMGGNTLDLFNKIEIPGNSIKSANWVEPKRTKLNVYLTEKLDSAKETEIHFNGLECISGYIMNDTVIKMAMPRKAEYLDIVINEIMPYTTDDKSKFVELYNNSDDYFDMSKMMLANRDEHGKISNAAIIAENSIILPPRRYAVLSGDTSKIGCPLGINPESTYLNINMPSLSSTNGNIMITDRGGKPIDELQYSSKWHHPMIKDRHNVSLERINPNKMTQDSLNWHSAASSIGYQSAGWENSQTIKLNNNENTNFFRTEEPCFTPDNDGYNDMLEIEYSLPKNGFVMTADIYTRDGTIIGRIANNILLERSGKWLWNGENKHGEIVQTGIYVIVIEAIHPDGDKIRKKIIAIKGW